MAEKQSVPLKDKKINLKEKEQKMEKQAEELAEKEMEKEVVETEEKTEGAHEEQLKEMKEVVETKEKVEEEKVSKEADAQFKKTERGRGEYVRESREDRFAREAQEKLDAWVPRTELGKLVRAGKIKNIDEIFEKGLKIMEPQIVDLLVKNLKTDTLFIGQAKGKFGGGKRRAFRQTQKKTKEGNVLTFGVMAIVGDGKGHIGVTA